jgi:hypothetical protein
MKSNLLCAAVCFGLTCLSAADSVQPAALQTVLVSKATDLPFRTVLSPAGDEVFLTATDKTVQITNVGLASSRTALSSARDSHDQGLATLFMVNGKIVIADVAAPFSISLPKDRAENIYLVVIQKKSDLLSTEYLIPLKTMEKLPRR